MELTKVIAENITRLLEENNLTQGELSNYLDISRQTLSNYLRGTSTIDTVRLVKTAEFLGVAPSVLLENSSSTKPLRCPILLRSIVRTHDPISSIESTVFDYLERYEHLAQAIGITSRFLPEQHDLYINHRGAKININYELNNVPPVKFKVDDELRNEIYTIADSQRRLLGLNEPGAIELIPALIQRGVKIFFLDFHSSNIWGLSICDNIHGCCIFVNKHSSIPIERQLFTVAHEFAHIILHRPLLSTSGGAPLSTQYIELLDKMADEFAGRLLCPPDAVASYAKYFNYPDATLKSIFLFAVRLKKKLQISLSSLLISLNHYGIISKSIVSEYYRWANVSGYIEKEFAPISDDTPLKEYFEHVRDSHLVELLRRVHENRSLSLSEISYYLDCDVARASAVLKDLNDDFSDFI